jgi:transcriptional regulator of arginine metabolism
MHVVPDAAHSVSGIVSLEVSGQMAVIRTRPGYANMLGAVVDASVGSGIMGTIAGDDTLLLILRQDTGEAALVAALTRFLPGIEDKLIKY